MSHDPLNDAVGYRVETTEGTLGSVAAVLPDIGRVPGALLVHTDSRTCTLTAVRFDDVDHVDIGARRIMLRADDQPPRRRTRARRSSSAPQTTRGKASRMSKSVPRRGAVPKSP